MSLPSEPSVSSADPLAKPPKSKRGMSRNQKVLFFVTGWLIVLMPFLFWWNTWFGRHLSDQQMTEYLHDLKKPRHIQHALVQLGDRMSHADANVKRWYLAGSRSGERAGAASAEAADEIALGYEAADPALQSRHWPDAPTRDR